MRNKMKSCRHHAAGNGDAFVSSGAGKASQTRAREPVGRSFGSVRGKFPSKKNGRMIHWESQLERDAIYIFEFSPGVANYREQPFKTHYTLGGQTRRYTPDFLVTLLTGERIVIEVKPAKRLRDPSEHCRFDRITGHLQQFGDPFQILTEQQIRQPQLLENLHLLHRYRGERFTPLERRLHRERLSALPEITLASVRLSLNDSTAIWNLIDEGILTCDLRMPLNAKTIFNIVWKESSNADIYF